MSGSCSVLRARAALVWFFRMVQLWRVVFFFRSCSSSLRVLGCAVCTAVDPLLALRVKRLQQKNLIVWPSAGPLIPFVYHGKCCFFIFESFGIRAWTRFPLRTFEPHKTLNSQSVIEIIVFGIVTTASDRAQGLCCWDKASFVTHRPWVFRMAQVDSLDVDCPRVMFTALAKATKLFEPSDYACAEMLATILRDCLWEKAGEHIDSAGEVAILSTYQSDSASFLTRSVVRGRVGGQAQKRVGMCSSEMLLERGFLLKRKVSGEARCSILLHEPRILSEGKTIGICSRPRASSSSWCARGGTGAFASNTARLTAPF